MLSLHTLEKFLYHLLLLLLTFSSASWPDTSLQYCYVITTCGCVCLQLVFLLFLVSFNISVIREFFPRLGKKEMDIGLFYDSWYTHFAMSHKPLWRMMWPGVKIERDGFHQLFCSYSPSCTGRKAGCISSHWQTEAMEFAVLKEQ